MNNRHINPSEVAKYLENNPEKIGAFLSHIETRSSQDLLVSDAFEALRELSNENAQLAQQLLDWFKTNSQKFHQDVAKAKMLKIALQTMYEDQELFTMFAALLGNNSSQMQANSVEYIVRYVHKFKEGSIEQYVDASKLKSYARAKLVKLKKELGNSSSLER